MNVYFRSCSGMYPRIATVLALLLSYGIAAAQQMDPDMQMPMSAPAAKSTTTSKPAAHPSKRNHQIRSVKPVAGHSEMRHAMPMPAGMDMQQESPTSAPPIAGTAPLTPIPVLTDVDRAAARPPAHDHPVHDNSIQHYTLIDQLETEHAGNGTAREWNAQMWIGTDLNRLRLRTEGTRSNGRNEQADVEVLYGRSVTAWWDVVAGLRHDFAPGRSQDFAAFGIVGMAPYKVHVEATAYVGQSGQTAARLEAQYETLFTNRLILQPRVELNLFGQSDSRRGIGSGLSTAQAGLRLRYEVTRRFAPYIGVARERAFGGTGALRRDNGQRVNDTVFVAGLRLWF